MVISSKKYLHRDIWTSVCPNSQYHGLAALTHTMNHHRLQAGLTIWPVGMSHRGQEAADLRPRDEEQRISPWKHLRGLRAAVSCLGCDHKSRLCAALGELWHPFQNPQGPDKKSP